MFGKLNHLAITSDHYTLLGMFYRAVFGLKASGDTAREIGAISVGDGYLGMTLIPRRENRAEVYAKGEWKQETTFSHFALRAREAERVANFYADVFELEARNVPTEDGGYQLTDGRVTMAIVPWKISSFNGAGIEQPGMDHIGFRVAELDAFKAHLDKVAKTNICLAPKPIDFDSEGAARLALLRKCPLGHLQLADPDGTLIDVEAEH